jgi:hypothetical protein
MLWGFFDGMPVNHFNGTMHSYRPGWLYSGKPDSWVRNERNVSKYSSVADACRRRGAKTVCLVRTYALGDVLMLLPVARAMKQSLGLTHLAIATSDEYYQQLRGWKNETGIIFLPAWRMDNQFGADLSFDLDSCLEADHWGGEESHKHRCVLYGEAVGLEVSCAH